MVIQAEFVGALWDTMPTLYFDEDCPIPVQLLFTGALGASVGVVVSYIVAELHRYFFKE